MDAFVRQRLVGSTVTSNPLSSSAVNSIEAVPLSVQKPAPAQYYPSEQYSVETLKEKHAKLQCILNRNTSMSTINGEQLQTQTGTVHAFQQRHGLDGHRMPSELSHLDTTQTKKQANARGVLFDSAD